MKNKWFVLLLILVSTCSVHAQIDKGTRSVYAHLSFNGTFRKDPSNPNTLIGNLNTGFSQGISKNWMLGVGLGLGRSNNTFENYNNGIIYSQTKSKNNAIGISLNATRFFEIKPKLFFFVAQNLGYSLNRITTSSKIYSTPIQTVVSKRNTHAIGYSVSPGIMYFVTPHWALSTQVGNASLGMYWSKQYANLDFSFTNTFRLSDLQVGVSYFWNKAIQKK